MPKLPAKFDDWTPPWADGEFDEDKAARLVFNALTGQEKAKARASEAEANLATVTDERDALKSKVETHGASETDLQRSLAAEQARVRDLKAQLDNVKDYDKIAAERDRLDVAIELGLTKSQAKRLVGDDREALEADARELASDLGIELPGDGDDGGGERRQEVAGGRVTTHRSRVVRAADLGNGGRDRGDAVQVNASAEKLAKDADLWGDGF